MLTTIGIDRKGGACSLIRLGVKMDTDTLACITTNRKYGILGVVNQAEVDYLTVTIINGVEI